MGFLWERARYRITSSSVSKSNGGSAILIVESEVLRLRFISDRRQLMLDMQPTFEAAPSWCQADLVQRLLDNGGPRSGLLEESYAFWMKHHLSEIEDLFRRDAWEATYERVLAIQRVREREMWGHDVRPGTRYTAD
jgi:hypothetical protein